MVHNQLKQIDTKELELPDTVFIRDIESRVFQSIALQCLARIDGIGLIEGNFIDTLLSWDSSERVKGIHVEQNDDSHSVNLKVEVNVAYGVCIPDKADEIQMKLVEEISRLTGLHVGRVHVVFRNLVSCENSLEDLIRKKDKEVCQNQKIYSDEF